MDLAKSIRTAYFRELNGSVLDEGNPVPVYDTFAPPEVEESYPYILLSTQDNNQRPTKTCKIYNGSLLIDIVTGSAYPTGRSQADDIGFQVNEIINPDDRVDVPVNEFWSIGYTNLEADNYLTEKSQNYYIYRKLLRYNHLISKH